MIDGPKFSSFRAWVEPSLSQKPNGGRLRFLSPPDGDEPEERQAKVKLAGFFAVVALVSVLAEHLGRVEDRTDANLGPDSTTLVSLNLSLPDRSGDRAGFTVRFRLSNSGNHSVFYPTDTKTSVPIGQLVARATPSSDWRSLSVTSQEPVEAVQELFDANLNWIEMPPGGWVDGKFHDTGESSEEHAYVIYVKPARDANGIGIVSKPYSSPAK
ncbi:MAG TPA: hypothetical protein VN976_19010 [Verrucomicrobiae bacterium]|nr:hypothetical protein [Verrucomicrobiae bacterium]